MLGIRRVLRAPDALDDDAAQSSPMRENFHQWGTAANDVMTDTDLHLHQEHPV